MVAIIRYACLERTAPKVQHAQGYIQMVRERNHRVLSILDAQDLNAGLNIRLRTESHQSIQRIIAYRPNKIIHKEASARKNLSRSPRP